MRAKKALELIYNELYSLINSPIFGETKYYILFINDFGRVIYIYIYIQKKNNSRSTEIIQGIQSIDSKGNRKGN